MNNEIVINVINPKYILGYNCNSFNVFDIRRFLYVLIFFLRVIIVMEFIILNNGLFEKMNSVFKEKGQKVIRAAVEEYEKAVEKLFNDQSPETKKGINTYLNDSSTNFVNQHDHAWDIPKTTYSDEVNTFMEHKEINRLIEDMKEKIGALNIDNAENCYIF